MEEAHLLIGGTQIVIRLLVAALLGALIGFDRERQNQPAGLRTHTILAVGSALAMIISVNLANQYKDFGGPDGDPARLAAQVISGIGFLGAGAIFRFGPNVRGITTATSLWTLAVIGLSIGAGNFIAGIATTLILLVVLTILDWVEKRYIKTYKSLTIDVQVEDHPGVLEEIRGQILDQNTTITSTSVSRDFQNDVASISLVVKTLESAAVDDMVAHLSTLQGVKSFKIN